MLKSIQQYLVLSAMALAPAAMWGGVLSEDEARKVAAEFFQSGDVTRLATPGAFELAYVATDGGSTPVSYVFNARDGRGFVIVSADSESMPVIGYSKDTKWDVAGMPDAAIGMISAPVQMHDAGAGRRIFRVQSADEMETKLLTTPSWSQEAPFNNNIPNRRLTGCVGVALAEILKYHNYPPTRPASLVKPGEASEYAWAAMRDDNYRSGYTPEEAEGVATLVADAAIGIGTDFGMSSSSAFEVKVPYALISLFGYDAGVSYKKRDEMDKASWDALIVNEVNEGRPVLYCGQDVS
ncbi:MAG: C10 family peptidase, partial [Muribaculaceae bacterium]|nr:C10 family peptidase [Muribaculaceae bacterium]